MLLGGYLLLDKTIESTLSVEKILILNITECLYQRSRIPLLLPPLHLLWSALISKTSEGRRRFSVQLIKQVPVRPTSHVWGACKSGLILKVRLIGQTRGTVARAQRVLICLLSLLAL